MKRLSGLISFNQLDVLTTRRHLKSLWSLSGTSAHPTMVTLVNIMIMIGCLRSFSFHINQPPHYWDKAISDSLKLQGQGLGCGQRARSYNQPSIISTHFLFISHQKDRATSKFDLRHPRSRSWVRSKVKVIYCTQYPTNVSPFCFTSIGPTITMTRAIKLPRLVVI